MTLHRADERDDLTATGRARRSVLAAPGRSRIVPTPQPTPGPNELLVRVLVNGLCSSELPTWRQGPRDGDAVTLGHEPVGEVVGVGPGVQGPAAGDMVTGRFRHSFADLVIAHAEDVVVVPPGIPAGSAVGEPLGCVVEALRRADVDVGDRVAVVGSGFMGLCLLQILATSPVADLVAVDTRAESRQHALDHGATTAFEPREALDHVGPHEGFDVVFETAGVQPSLQTATELVRPHGTLAIVGYHQSDRHIDMQAWNWKALTVVNGHVRDRARLAESTRRGLELVAAGRIDYGALITHRYSLTEIDRAFHDLSTKPRGFVKAVIDVAPSITGERRSGFLR